MTLTEAQEILSEIGRGKLQNYLNPDGSIDVDAIVAGGRDIVEYIEEEAETPLGKKVRRKIKLSDQKSAIKELGDISNWQKSPAQRLNFTFNLDGETTKQTSEED